MRWREGAPYYDTYSLSLEGFDGLDVIIDVVCHGLEFVQQFLGVIYDGFVFQN